jgi:hypothetical protein
MTALRVRQAPEDVVRRYIELVRADLEPDPLFRRRLRGVVTNRFVAAREGLVEPVGHPSRLGRLGRACLYATFALAMSVGGALAASRGAAPGDLLYPLKLQVEAIRLETLPEQFHDDLLVYALSERMAEFGRLVEAGEMDRAEGLAEIISSGYHELAALGIAMNSDGLRARVAVLEAISDRLPADAHAAIEGALGDAPGLNGSASGRGPAVAPDTTGAAEGTRAEPADEPPTEVPPTSNGANPDHATPRPSPRASDRPAHEARPNGEDDAASSD